VARHAVEIVPMAVEKGFWAGETLQWDAQHREMPVSHLLLAHRDRQGRVETFSAILRDITAQKAAQQALHHSEAVLRGVTEAVPMSIAVFDHALHCIFANQGFEDWCGRRATNCSAAMRATCWAPTNSPHASRGSSALWPARARGLRARRRHAPAALARRSHPLFDQAGVVEGFVLVSADISASRAEERRLFRPAQYRPADPGAQPAPASSGRWRCVPSSRRSSATRRMAKPAAGRAALHRPRPL
jgi:PAS domain-containing protein